VALFVNDTLFKSPFNTTEAPKILFYRIEQCQEFMTLGKLPYTMEQVILNALCLLMASQIFPMREFNMWENMTVKTYPALKTFIYETYSRCLNLMELHNTPSSLGYTMPAHNMYHVLDMGKDDNSIANNTTVATVVVAVAASMMASSFVQGTAASSMHPGLTATINQSIAPAFNQVMQNQLILQNQIAAMSMAQPPPAQALAHQYIVPPVPLLLSQYNSRSQCICSSSNTTRPMDLAVDSKAYSKEDVAVKEAVVGATAVVAVDASVVFLLQPRFAPRMVKGKWSSTRP
jgi:hypothetical protein